MRRRDSDSSSSEPAPDEEGPTHFKNRKLSEHSATKYYNFTNDDDTKEYQYLRAKQIQAATRGMIARRRLAREAKEFGGPQEEARKKEVEAWKKDMKPGWTNRDMVKAWEQDPCFTTHKDKNKCVGDAACDWSFDNSRNPPGMCRLKISTQHAEAQQFQISDKKKVGPIDLKVYYNYLKCSLESLFKLKPFDADSGAQNLLDDFPMPALLAWANKVQKDDPDDNSIMSELAQLAQVSGSTRNSNFFTLGAISSSIIILNKLKDKKASVELNDAFKIWLADAARTACGGKEEVVAMLRALFQTGLQIEAHVRPAVAFSHMNVLEFKLQAWIKSMKIIDDLLVYPNMVYMFPPRSCFSSRAVKCTSRAENVKEEKTADECARKKMSRVLSPWLKQLALRSGLIFVTVGVFANSSGIFYPEAPTPETPGTRGNHIIMMGLYIHSRENIQTERSVTVYVFDPNVPAELDLTTWKIRAYQSYETVAKTVAGVVFDSPIKLAKLENGGGFAVNLCTKKDVQGGVCSLGPCATFLLALARYETIRQHIPSFKFHTIEQLLQFMQHIERDLPQTVATAVLREIVKTKPQNLFNQIEQGKFSQSPISKILQNYALVSPPKISPTEWTPPGVFPL